MLNFSLFKFNLLLEEVRLDYRINFENVLDLMSSPVAKSLLAARNKEVDVEVNNIGSTEVEDVVNFTSPKRFDSKVVWKPLQSFYPLMDIAMLSKIECEEPPRYTMISLRDRFIVEKEFSEDETKQIIGGHYLNRSINFRILKVKRLSDNKMFGIINGGESHQNLEKTDEIFPEAKPQEIKVGRLANRILTSMGNKFSHKEMEEFVNEFKAKIALLKDSFRNFELIEGEMIRHYYNEDNYDTEKRGTLHSSCMRYPECETYFDIYVFNPEVCKLLIMKSDKNPDKICARALVWKTINGDTFVDRIYFSKESDPALFKEYAEKMGWYCKGPKGAISRGDEFIKSLTVKLSKWNFKRYPFIDTICYLDRSTGILSEENGDCLQDTGGGIVAECDTCGGEGTVECSSCYGRGNSECSKCHGSGEKECKECGGDGKIECDCGGDKECDHCEGSEEIDCKECSGDGTISCDECDGDGNIECEECNGNGSYDCPECS